MGGEKTEWDERVVVWFFYEYCLGTTMGQGGDEFYLPRPHTLLSYIYLLRYPYPTGMRNQITSPSSTSSVFAPHPHPRNG